MKKTICIILALSLLLSLSACGSGSEDLMATVRPNCGEQKLDAPTDFGLRLFRESHEGQQNTLISPLSVLCALAMTANGAEGETLEQMEAVLGLDVQNLNIWISSYMTALNNTENGKLSLANSIWFKDADSFAVNQDFLQLNTDYFGAGLFTTPFDDTTKNDINRWVAENTDGMVKDILDEISQGAVMYLVNALAFDAQWQEIYKESDIYDAEFTTETGTKQTVEMMCSMENRYLEDDLATGFMKYYEGEKYAFVALLPKAGVFVEEYLDSLTGEKLQALLENADDTKVYCGLPKFELEYNVEMSEILKSMGMTDAFDANLADFSAMAASDEDNLCISRVQHKTYICVDGKGTKAGAATAVEMAFASTAEEPDFYSVILDRPFVFMLIDTQSKLPFFIGTMMDPSGEFQQSQEPVLENPPELTVLCGGDEYSVRSGNYSWTAPGPNGEMSAVIACGAHPLDHFNGREFFQADEPQVTLSFPVEPDEIIVQRWPSENMGNVIMGGENVPLDGLTFTLEEGKWVYEITARWDRDCWSGEAEYHLYFSK